MEQNPSRRFGELFLCNASVTLTDASVLQPPLVQAIFNRNAEEVQLLLHSKEDVNALVCTNSIYFAKISKRLSCVGPWSGGGICK